MATFAAERDQSLEALHARRADRGLGVSTSALSRFFLRHAMTRKQDRARGRAGSTRGLAKAARLAFAKLKALLRKAAERTVDGLWEAIGRLLDVFTPQECTNSFAAAGYDAD